MAHKRYRSILLFGAPGVGKGTQGRVLGAIPGFFHLACGDVFRSLDISSQEGRETREYISRGELVPDDLTIRIWRKGLDGYLGMSQYKPWEDLLVLDGIPRNLRQAQILEDHLEVLQVVYLICKDEDAMVHRIQRRAIRENRADDGSEGVIRHRFDVYREETEPVLAHYDESIVSRVDAFGSPAEVLRSVLDVLIPIQNELFRDRRP
ncbi:MAG: nucleoside monophosphate kinase [Planctomycetaceae bacterium]|nr:nucleoside monophosphate kinase [Planctomycetaceae bacterium]